MQLEMSWNKVSVPKMATTLYPTYHEGKEKQTFLIQKTNKQKSLSANGRGWSSSGKLDLGKPAISIRLHVESIET